MPLKWTLKEWLIANRDLQLPINQAHTNAKQIQHIIQQQTGRKLPLRMVHTLLEKQPNTLDYRILQVICDAFQCQLKHFCAVTPSSRPAEHRRDVNIQHLLQPCAIDGNESLHSFIIRVQLAAITEAVLMTGNFSRAARLLGSNRVTLRSIRRRNQHVAKNQPPSTYNAIPLPAAIFTVKANEDFDSFKRRIQRAAIIETINLEGNHTRAALRLGYNRTSLARCTKKPAVAVHSTADLRTAESKDLFRTQVPL